MAASPYDDLNKANEDYHKALDRIFKEGNDFIPDITERARVKALLGAMASKVLALMDTIKAFLIKYYGK